MAEVGNDWSDLQSRSHAPQLFLDLVSKTGMRGTALAPIERHACTSEHVTASFVAGLRR